MIPSGHQTRQWNIPQFPQKVIETIQREDYQHLPAAQSLAVFPRPQVCWGSNLNLKISHLEYTIY